jgi:hypothetical protein
MKLVIVMPEPTEPWLQAPCKENGYKWRVYGMGTVWDHSQEWQALWKLHYLQVAAGTTQEDVPRFDSGLPQ